MLPTVIVFQGVAGVFEDLSQLGSAEFLAFVSGDTDAPPI